MRVPKMTLPPNGLEILNTRRAAFDEALPSNSTFSQNLRSLSSRTLARIYMPDMPIRWNRAVSL